ncbi:MAG TPA: hypothetical protein VMT54_13055 [Candidatus Cybelea sp.]|nr:hypothetical protein [Candidatus Cybelea sp.]
MNPAAFRHVMIAAMLSALLAGSAAADCTNLRRVLDAESSEGGKMRAYAPPSGGALLFLDSMTLDTDGAPKAYHPNDYDPEHPGRCPASGLGLDCPANGGYPDSGYAFASCPTGNRVPCDAHGFALQGPQDEAPGYLVSATAFHAEPDYLQKNHVDASVVPYVALPGGNVFRDAAISAGVTHILGEIGVAYDRQTKKIVPILVGDNSSRIGSRYAHLGEGSIALTRELRGKDNPRNQSISDKNILVVILEGTPVQKTGELFLGTADGKAAVMKQIAEEADRRLAALGGNDWLSACADTIAAGGPQ